MALQRRSEYKSGIKLKRKNKLASILGALLVLSAIWMIGSLVSFQFRRLEAVSGRPVQHGIGRVESVIVSGKIPQHTITFRMSGEHYLVTFSDLHDVAPGTDADVTFRVSQSGDVVIGDIQRIRPIH